MSKSQKLIKILVIYKSDLQFILLPLIQQPMLNLIKSNDHSPIPLIIIEQFAQTFI